MLLLEPVHHAVDIIFQTMGNIISADKILYDQMVIKHEDEFFFWKRKNIIIK